MAAFFVLAYCLSWGSYYILSGPFLFPFGSIFAALLIAAITNGKEGLKDILNRCLQWRVGFKWYVVAMIVPLVIALSAGFITAMTGTQPLPRVQPWHWYDLVLLFPMTMIDAPLWEEIGWRGYAMPKFPSNRSRLFNTAVLGLLLAGWHLPIALSGGSVATPYLIGCLASAVVTNWVYYNTNQSALFAVLYHTAANAIAIFLYPLFPGTDLVRFYWALALVNIFVAVIIIVIKPGFWLKSDRQE